MQNRSMQIRDANWQSSFLYQFICFPNKNIWKVWDPPSSPALGTRLYGTKLKNEYEDFMEPLIEAQK